MKKMIPIFLILVFFSAYSAFLPSEKNNIDVYQKASPNVVSVHRYRQVMNEFYQPLVIPQGMGSGFVWDKKGHIITNFHVVRGTRVIAVSLNNLTIKATVVGAEPRKDIAVLKVSDKRALKKIAQMTPFQMAKTHELLVGQKTLAIGNPFGLDHSLTTGVISALGRKVPGIVNTINDMIQTDASINPGNSGGPLLDSRGHLIGMNTAIYSQSGSSSGIGFAVPADDIKRIANQIIKHGRVVLAGIGVQRIDTQMAKRLGVNQGVLIGRVIPGSPAQKAGLRGTYRNDYGQLHLGDVIVGVNGHVIKNYDDLYNLMADMEVGQVITVKVKRGDKVRRLKLKTIDIAKQQEGY